MTDPGDKPMPLELLVGIADKTTQQAGPRTPQPRAGADTEGGFSFNSATPIGPGTHRQSIAVGEAPFWRVELKAGQKLTVRAGVDIPADFPNSVTTGWNVDLYNAQREQPQCNENEGATDLFASRTGHIERFCGPWEITEQDDAKGPHAKGYDVPGTYYIQAQVTEPDAEAKGIVVPISLTVNISGTPRARNGPVFSFGDDAAQGPSQSGANGNAEQGGTGGVTATAKANDSLMGKVALLAAIGAGVILMGGLTFYALRRRRAS